MHVDPGAKDLINKLTARVDALEDQVRKLLDRNGIQPPVAPPVAGPPDGVLALIQAGKTIEAIKAYREETGSSLQGAKAAVDRLAAEHGL